MRRNNTPTFSEDCRKHGIPMPHIKKDMNVRPFLLHASAGEQILHFTTKFAVALQLQMYRHEWRCEYPTTNYYIDIYDLTTGTAYQVGSHTKKELADLAHDPMVRDVIHVPIPNDGITTAIFELLEHVRKFCIPSKQALRSTQRKRRF